MCGPPPHLVADRRERAVGAAVVDQDDLEIEDTRKALGRGTDALQQERHVPFLVV